MTLVFDLTQSNETANFIEKGPTAVSEVIAQVLVSDFSMFLSKEDAAFLCGIHAHLAITRQPGLEEEELDAIYNAVVEAAMLDASQRASTAIQRLRKQGLIERADARGMASYGLYTLSSLAVKLRDEIFEREKLTKRSLQVMMKQIIASLATIARHADVGGDADFWNEEVIDPLRHLVVEVIRSLIMRQKGLDADQMNIRRQIAELLKLENWHESVRICNNLLDTTSRTLHELHNLLMQEMGVAQNLLLEISEASVRHEHAETYQTVSGLYEQITSIAIWSEAFQNTWSEYYTKTHEFMRFSIRVDPNRKLSHRMRESIKSYAQNPWLIRYCSTDRMRYLREETDIPSMKALATINVQEKKPTVDTMAEKDALRTQIIGDAQIELAQAGSITLSQFLRPYVETLDEDNLFLAVSYLTFWLMEHAELIPQLDLNWVQLRGTIEIQDITAVPLQVSTEQRQKAKEKAR